MKGAQAGLMAMRNGDAVRSLDILKEEMNGCQEGRETDVKDGS